MGIFLLLAVVVLAGCRTSKPTPVQTTGGNSSAIAKTGRHHIATPRAPAKATKLPTPDAGQTNPPATLTTIPAPTPKPPPVVAPDSAAANIANAPVVQPAPVTPTETAPLAVGNPAAPVAKPESAGRSSLTVPDTVINPVPPVDARPTLNTSPTSVPPDKIPSAVNLSRLASPAGDLPAPNRPAVIRLPTLDDQAPTRTAPPSLNSFFRPTSPDTVSISPANPPGLHLATDDHQTSPPMVSSNPFSALPLPVPASVSWPANARPAAPTPGLSNWLASPAPAPQPAPAANHEARATLHQKIYNVILGN